MKLLQLIELILTRIKCNNFLTIDSYVLIKLNLCYFVIAITYCVLNDHRANKQLNFERSLKLRFPSFLSRILKVLIQQTTVDYIY